MIPSLIAALLALHDTHLNTASAEGNAGAALVAEVPGLDAPLLLAVAWRETRFEASSVAGHWSYCGPLQTQAHGAKADCLAMQDLTVGYRLGAEELSYWLGRSHGNLAKALAHHACGNSVRYQRHDGSWCNGMAYAGGVLRMAAQLRAATIESV